MSTTQKFDAILTRHFGANPAAHDEAIFNLFSMAWELDSLRSRLQADADEMARRFARYATEVAEGRMGEPPTGWSTLRDLDREYATLDATLKAFKAAFKLATGLSLNAVVVAQADDDQAVAAADKAVAAGEVRT